MNLLWIILTLMTSVAAVTIAVPLARRFDPVSEKDKSISVYKDQIRELDRELEQEQIDEESAKLAKLEIERRIVAKARKEVDNAVPVSPKIRSFALVATCGFVVIGSTILYTAIGKPGIPSAAFAGKSQPASTGLQSSATVTTNSSTAGQNPLNPVRAGNVDQLIATLAARLQKQPNDAAGWRMLGWSYFNTEKYDKASEAYAKSVALVTDDPDTQSAYGEALVRASQGFVTKKALAVFDKALALDANNPRAHFFKGLALEQAGNFSGAIEIWIKTLNEAPTDADWVESLDQRVRELAAAKSIDLSGRLPGLKNVAPSTAIKPEKGPTVADIQAAAGMKPEDRQAMIRGMVDQLAERLNDKPRDADGWIKLMRSRMVLSEPEAAQMAFERALKIFSDEKAASDRIIAAATILGLDNSK